MDAKNLVVNTAFVAGCLFVAAGLFFISDYLQGIDMGNARALNFGLTFTVIWAILWIPAIHKLLSQHERTN